MKMRLMMTLMAVVLMLSLVTACGSKNKSLDFAGLKLGKDLTGMLGDATKLLGGITDLDSAKAALPKLTKMDTGLDDIVSKAAKLSPESKDSFTGLVMKAIPTLEGAISKLNDIPGVGSTLKPVCDSILAKVKSLI